MTGTEENNSVGSRSKGELGGKVGGAKWRVEGVGVKDKRHERGAEMRGGKERIKVEALMCWSWVCMCLRGLHNTLVSVHVI